MDNTYNTLGDALCPLSGGSGPENGDGASHDDQMRAWRAGLVAGVQQLAAEIEEGGEDVELELDLDLVPLLLQYALSSGMLAEDHVAVLSMKRMLLRAFRMEHAVPPEVFENLKSFGVTKQKRLGRKATYLDRGRSEAGLSPGWQAADFFALTNGGGYGVRTIINEMAAAPAEPGPQITDYLNMLEVARSRRGFGSTWAPNSSTCVTLGVAAFDGMLTRLGHVTDEATMTNRGSLGHDVHVEEAKNLLEPVAAPEKPVAAPEDSDDDGSLFGNSN